MTVLRILIAGFSILHQLASQVIAISGNIFISFSKSSHVIDWLTMLIYIFIFPVLTTF